MTDSQPATSRTHGARQALIWVVKIVVSGGLLYRLMGQVDLDRLWSHIRTASIPWFLAALGLYLAMILISSWRWKLLLAAQHIAVPAGKLVNSYLVATFFNNFLPSNIGGDVIRIGDTVRAAKSKTLATTIVLVDRGIGLLGLVFVAAVGATLTARMSDKVGPVGPGLLWAMFGGGASVATAMIVLPHGVGFLLRPLRTLHQEWVEERIERLTTALGKFRDASSTVIACFAWSVVVQLVLVGFYAAIAKGLHLEVPTAHLAFVVPVSFIVQMLPISVNGLGVREQLFGSYFQLLGEPIEWGIALSLTSAALIMLFSVSGAVAYLTRRRPSPRAHPQTP